MWLWEWIWPVSYPSIFMLRTKVHNDLARWFRTLVRSLNAPMVQQSKPFNTSLRIPLAVHAHSATDRSIREGQHQLWDGRKARSGFPSQQGSRHRFVSWIGPGNQFRKCPAKVYIYIYIFLILFLELWFISFFAGTVCATTCVHVRLLSGKGTTPIPRPLGSSDRPLRSHHTAPQLPHQPVQFPCPPPRPCFTCFYHSLYQVGVYLLGRAMLRSNGCGGH